MLVLVLVLVLAGCGSSTPPAAPAGPPAAFAPTPADDDAVVARVSGRPVYASCVSAQATAHHLDARAALGECIDFELLAQAAEAKGLALDHEVALATRTALVSRLLETAYENDHTVPTGPEWDKWARKNTYLFKREEYRGSTYVRVPLGEQATDADAAAAKALADKIAAALAPETGMLPVHVRAAAERVVPGLVECKADTKTPCYGDVPPYRVGWLEEHYADALFKIPEVGRASASVRTKWGWDVIVWTADVPAADMPADELAQKLLPGWKQYRFAAWVHDLARAMNLHVVVEPTVEASLGTLQ